MINLLKIEWSFTSSNTYAFMETLRLNLGGQVQAPPLKTLAPIISVFFTEQKAEELQAENMFIVNASTSQHSTGKNNSIILLYLHFESM